MERKYSPYLTYYILSSRMEIFLGDAYFLNPRMLLHHFPKEFPSSIKNSLFQCSIGRKGILTQIGTLLETSRQGLKQGCQNSRLRQLFPHNHILLSSLTTFSLVFILELNRPQVRMKKYRMYPCCGSHCLYIQDFKYLSKI